MDPAYRRRGSGRTLIIPAHSADLPGKIKQPMQAHADDMSFGDVAKMWGEKAGLSQISVASSLDSVKRKYWAIANESFMTWGARMAKELGATFKIIGSNGVFLPGAGGESASGQALMPIVADWGDNLLPWSIAPVLSRPNFDAFTLRSWDAVKAEWMSTTAPATVSPTPTSSRRRTRIRRKAAPAPTPREASAIAAAPTA